jgi:hypothetical protein
VQQASGRIGLVDPLSGTVDLVTTGEVLAVGDWGLVRIDCPHVLDCALRWGPWEDVDRSALPIGTLPPGSWRGLLAADGSLLAVQSDLGWWLLDERATAVRQGPPGADQVLPLADADAIAVSRAGVVTLEHVDGRRVTLLDTSTAPASRRPVVAVAYRPAR